MTTSDLAGSGMLDTVQAAGVAELVWLDVDGRPDATPVTPLVLAGRPAVAFPYAYEQLARRVGGSSAAALCLTDTRMTGSTWSATAVLGPAHLVADHEGTRFTEELLTQELRKYPPSRALADSAILRREHWWYLPRLIAVVEPAAAIPLSPREGGHGELLAVAAGGRLHVDTVERATPPGDATTSIEVRSLSGRTMPAGPAVLLAHDFSVPDLERWASWLTRGAYADGGVSVDEAPERTTLEPPLTLRERLRRHRDLGRACRKALRT